MRDDEMQLREDCEVFLDAWEAFWKWEDRTFALEKPSRRFGATKSERKVRSERKVKKSRSLRFAS